MIGSAWLLAGCLLAGAVAVAWPAGVRSQRRLASSASSVRLTWQPVDLAALWTRVEGLVESGPGRLLALAAASAALVGWVLGGPVAAMICAVYAMLATRAAIRRAAKRRSSAARAKSLDDLCALAADLRAGLPPALAAEPAIAGAGRPAARAGSVSAEERIAVLTGAVWRLAERTGAPAAELVERIEADARTADRGRASAQAQAAGAQATALLLAALPLGGIALGYGIGVDPLRVLLHSPLGAACAGGAVLLQCAGLFWADRLASGPVG